MSSSFFKFRQMPLLKALQILQEDIEKASNEPNFEKAKNYADHFPELLIYIFGIENQSISGWMEKVYQNYSKAESENTQNSEITHQEFTFLVYLLSPPDSTKTKNLFTFVLSNFHQEKRYEFEVKRLPQNTQFLIEQKRFDSPVLSGYFSFLDSGRQALSHDGKKLILTIFELFIFVLISSMKNFIGKNYVDLKNTQDYVRDDFEVEFLRNPYLVLVRRYLDFCFRERKQRQGRLFNTLLFLLQDFTINDYIYSPIVVNQLSMMQHGNRTTQNNAAMVNNNRKVPKPHLLQVVYLVVHYFLKNHDADIELKRNDFLQNSGFFAKSLYHFLVNVLEAWNQDISNSGNLLCFIGRVWLKFLKPWEINENYCIINCLNRFDAGKGIEFDDFGNVLKEFRVSKELSRKENAQFISHFLKENVLFYTHVLVQFLVTLSDQNEVHFKDVIFLKDMLDFFIGHNFNGPINTFFNGFINVNWIKQLAMGGNNKIEVTLDVIQYLDYMGAKLHNLNLFNDDAVSSRVLKTIANLTRFAENFKKKKSTGYFQKKDHQLDHLIDQAEKSVKHIVSQLSLMFSIEANQAESMYEEIRKNQDGAMKYRKHIKTNANKQHYLSWETPLGRGESQFLYDFYIYVAKGIDFCLGKKSVGYNNTYPITNLRILVSPNNTLKCLICICVVILLLYVILMGLVERIFE